ncbi:MAG TPA: hypothetical protein VGM06_10580 [Polyangiaceae bacterium]|jgi:hypothetical protein
MEQNVVTFTEDETPTQREAPSGRWIVSVDRGARKLEAAISALEDGADVADVLDELKEAHTLVNGGAR